MLLHQIGSRPTWRRVQDEVRDDANLLAIRNFLFVRHFNELIIFYPNETELEPALITRDTFLYFNRDTFLLFCFVQPGGAGGLLKKGNSVKLCGRAGYFHCCEDILRYIMFR